MEQQEITFWTISVYADQKGDLAGVPCGFSEQYGIADIDVLLRLKAPYTDERLERYIEEIMEACYTKRHNDASDHSTIEKYRKIKGFAKATRDLTLITIVKTPESGYSIMPTFNDYERGPLSIEDDEVCLPLQYQKGEMAKTLRRMIDLYGKVNARAMELAQEE